MAKSALAGQMKTRVIVKRLKHVGEDPEGYPIRQWENVIGPDEKLWCKWVNAYGTEAYQARRLDMAQQATITLRYTPEVDVRCRVWAGVETDAECTDGTAWEVVSVNNVEDTRRFLDVLLKRVVVA